MEISNYIGYNDGLYWYCVNLPRTTKSNKKRITKKLLKKTGWRKISKSKYEYMFDS